MQALLGFILLTHCLILSSCSDVTQPAHDPENSLYVWNRVWTEPVQAAFLHWSSRAEEMRVLSAQFEGTDPVVVPAVPWSLLSGTDVRLRLVYRLEGLVLPPVTEVAQRWIADTQLLSAADIAPVGIEIDHDAPRSQMPQFAEWLSALRGSLPGKPDLAITLLPDWLQSDSLPQLLAVSDRVTLQVHAVAHPGEGLLPASRALAWIRALDAQSPVPFQVALPSYWYSVHRNQSGAIVSVAAEAPTGRRSSQEETLATPPVVIARFQQAVLGESLRRFGGWAWFRMPVESDRRSFDPDTLEVLMRGDTPDDLVVLKFRPVGTHTQDMLLVNLGRHTASPAPDYFLPEGCTPGHLAASFQLIDGRLVTPSRLLQPGTSLPAGWLQCTEP